jgi:hypothetical protein
MIGEELTMMDDSDRARLSEKELKIPSRKAGRRCGLFRSDISPDDPLRDPWFRKSASSSLCISILKTVIK